MKRGAILVLAMALAGCAGNRLSLLANEDDGRTGSVGIYDTKSDKEIAVVDKVGGVAAIAGNAAKISALGEAAFNARYGGLVAGLPQQPQAFTLYFREGSVDPDEKSAPLLGKIFDEIKRRPGPDLAITGHTDTVGSSDDNDALSLRRAAEITSWLFSLGLDRTIVRVGGRGERELFEATPDDTDWPANRRVEVIVR